VPDASVRQWASGGYVPGHFGLWGISGPLIVVEVAGPRIAVRLRPKFLARLLGAAPLIAEPGTAVTITTSKLRAGWGWFIKFQLPGKRPYSFMTTTARKNEVLSCLADVGFEVSPAEHK
jgi:hypothetical protein